MKKLFNIFLLCLLAMTATAQSVQTHRLRIRLMPEKVLFFNLQCFDPTSQIRLSDYGYMIEGEEIVDLCSDTIDVDLQVPVGSIIIIKPFQYKGDDNAYKLVNWKTSGGIVKLTEVKGNHLWRMPDYDVDLVGTFEYDPGVPDEGEQPGLGKWDAATGTLIIEGKDGREPVGFTYSDADKVLRYIRVSNSYAGETVYFSCGTFPNCTFFDASRTNAKSVNVSRSWAQERTALKEAVLPATIQTIGANAFEGSDLQTLVLYALTPPEMGMMVKNYDTNEMEWKTPFPDCTNMTVRVPADAVPLYQAAEHWKDYTILAIDGSYANLTVQLMAKADESLLEQYKNMSLVLTNKTSGQTRRYLMSGNNSYEFRYLTMNSLYKVQLLNDRNVEVAVADNIYLDKDKTVTFDRLRRIHQLSMALTKEGKLVDQSLYSVTWLDKKGYYLKKSHALSNMLDDEQLRCAVSIDRTLAMTYQRPDTMLVTVGAYGQPDDIKYALQLLKDTTVTVTVIDSVTRRGISDAVVQITQLLTNNESGQTVTLTTGTDGKATGKVLATLSRITVTSPVHGTQAFIINLADYTELTTEFQPANGTVIQLNHTWQAAVEEGVQPTVEQGFSAARSLDYEFHALLPNGTDSLITHYVTNYPSYTLYTDLPKGSKVRVKAIDTRNKVDSVEVEGALDENGNVQLTLPIVERGYIEASYTLSESRRAGLLVIDAKTGNLVTRQTFGNYSLTEVRNLPAGQYYVAALSQGPQYSTIGSLLQLQRYTIEKDYVMDTIDVITGRMAKAEFVKIPLTTTTLESNLSEHYANWNQPLVPIAANVQFGIKIAFEGIKDRVYNENAEEDYPTDCKLEVYLSDIFSKLRADRSARYYLDYSSSHIGGGSGVYSGDGGRHITTDEYLAGGKKARVGGMTTEGCTTQWDEATQKLTIDWKHPEEGGKMTISATAEREGTCYPEVYLTYTLKGKQYAEVLETTPITVSKATFNSPEIVIKPTFKVTGTGQHFPKPKPLRQMASPSYQAPRKKGYGSLPIPIEDDDPFGEYMCVTIMDGDQPIGNTYVNEQGEWEATVTLHNATTLSRHNIYAKMDYPNGVKTQTESRVVTYDPNAVVPLTTKMSFFNHHPQHLVNTEVLFDYVNMSTNPVSYGFSNEEGYNTDFTFEVNLSNNDTTKVYACAVFIYTDGPDAEERIVMAHYNARKNRWIAYDKFNTRSLPYCVMAEPFYYEDVVGSREDVDNSYNYYEDLRKQDNVNLEELRGKIQEVIDRGNIAYEKGEPVPLDELLELGKQLSAAMGIESSQDLEESTVEEIQAKIDEIEKEAFGIEDIQNLMKKAYNELGELVKGFTISTADGMTAESLEASGYTKMALDDGSVIYFLFTKESDYIFVDLKQNTKITINNSILAASRVFRASSDLSDVNAKKALILQHTIDIEKYAIKIDNTCQNIETKIAGMSYDLRIEAEKLDSKAKEPLITWLEAIAVEAGKLSISLTLEQLEKVYAACKKFRASSVFGGLTTIYSAVSNLKSLVENVEKSNSLLRSIDGEAKSCSDASTSLELRHLYGEYLSFVKDNLDKQECALYYDAASLGLLVGELALTTTGVGTVPAAVGIIATIGGIAISIYSSCALATEFDDKLDYYSFLYTVLHKRCQLANNCYLRGDCPDCVKLGTCPNWPRGPKNPKCPTTKPTLDPSGFVYEGIESNRLEGVTATVFFKETTKNIFGEDEEKVYMWDAENYAQVNPQVTDENGEYGWMVPTGLWQVKYEKQGYQTEYSNWLPVPPPQLDVNQNMRQLTAPQVSNVKATPQAVTISFDKYMKVDSLTSDRIFVTKSGEQVAGSIEPIMPTDAAEALRRIADKVRFIPTAPLTAGQTLTLTVKGSVESYADVPMGNDYQQQFGVVAVVEELRADSAVHVLYNQATALTIQALPAAAASGKTASVKVVSDMIATADKQELVFDAQGYATLMLTGEAHGTTALVLQMTDDAEVQKTVVVNVKDESDFVCPMPEVNYQPSQAYALGTKIELTCELPEATIYYTLDGTCPCAENSPSVKRYEAAIELTGEMLIKAFAKAKGYADSEIAEYQFLIEKDKDGIETVILIRPTSTTTYTLSGVKLTDEQQPGKGVYIRNNKKIVVK